VLIDVVIALLFRVPVLAIGFTKKAKNNIAVIPTLSVNTTDIKGTLSSGNHTISLSIVLIVASGIDIRNHPTSLNRDTSLSLLVQI